ncbi:MAG: lysostaphin resistance A-like protein [Pikeienuella sp.]
MSQDLANAAVTPAEPGRGRAFRAYLEAGAGACGLWRLLPGLLVVLLCWLGSTALVLIGLVLFRMHQGMSTEAALADLPDLIDGGGPDMVAVLLATFFGIWIGFALVLPLLHRRRFSTLFGADGSLGTGELIRGAALGILFYLITLAGALAVGPPPIRTELPLDIWAAWLTVLLVCVFIQAGGEELIFRGYLAQEIGRRLPHPLAWALIPSMIFGLLHYSPDLPGVTGLLYAVVTCIFGLTAAALVWRTGRLGAAIGLHLGFNICGLSLAGLEGVVSGSQLWLFRQEGSTPLFLADAAGSLALLALVLSPLGGRLFPGDRRRPA